MTQLHPSRAARRQRFHHHAAEWAEPAHVTVAWSSEAHAGFPTHTEVEVELVAKLTRSELHWLADLAAARCHEVVLTARVGKKAPARHLVLELAELLTVELAATQPLIRVLFAEERAHRAAPPARSLPRYDEFSTIGAI